MIEPSMLVQCQVDVEAALGDCGPAAALQPPTPSSCLTVLQGLVVRSAACHSSHECSEGLYCRGAAHGQLGQCVLPAVPGAACDERIDTLAALLGGGEDSRHRSCEGSCVRGRCLPSTPASASALRPTALCDARARGDDANPSGC